jgi:hypothetical protein
VRTTLVQEEVLARWLEGLQRQILATNHATVRESVIQLPPENDDLEPLGMHRTTRFLKRHLLLEISYGRAMDIQQLLALDSSTITPYFDREAEPRLQHKMDLDDIQNMGRRYRGDRTLRLP